MRHTNISKLICSLLICSMFFASGTFVFASDNSEFVDNMKSATLVRNMPSQTIAGHKHGGFKAVIDKLVEEGKLSREKASEIDKYLKQKRDEKQGIRNGHKFGLIQELVDAKIINDTEAEAIRSKFREMKEQALNEKLNALIQKGTITQAQADKVKVYFENARKEKTEQFEKLQNMTEEQRQAFFKEHKKDNVMTKLVEDGVLTQEQAQALKKALRNGYKRNCNKH